MQRLMGPSKISGQQPQSKPAETTPEIEKGLARARLQLAEIERLVDSWLGPSDDPRDSSGTADAAPEGADETIHGQTHQRYDNSREEEMQLIARSDRLGLGATPRTSSSPYFSRSAARGKGHPGITALPGSSYRSKAEDGETQELRKRLLGRKEGVHGRGIASIGVQGAASTNGGDREEADDDSDEEGGRTVAVRARVPTSRPSGNGLVQAQDAAQQQGTSSATVTSDKNGQSEIAASSEVKRARKRRKRERRKERIRQERAA